MTEPSLLPLLRQIAAALDRLAPADPPSAALDSAEAFIWHAEGSRLEAVDRVSRVELELLRGVDRNRDILLDNTRRFARGLPANNALLWGARGTGKSSLVKAVHAAVNAEGGGALALIEIHREDLASLPRPAGAAQGPAAALPPVLRRPLLRCGRHQLQIPEGGAGGRHRGAAGQCDLLRHLQPPASACPAT